MRLQIEIPRTEVNALCQRWQVVELAFFGSVLRNGFTPNSDVDVLVRFGAEARHTLFDMVTMQDDLKQIPGRDADLVERTALEQSRNYIRRKASPGSAEVVYAA